jgi:hypothetical protein
MLPYDRRREDEPTFTFYVPVVFWNGDAVTNWNVYTVVAEDAERAEENVSLITYFDCEVGVATKDELQAWRETRRMKSRGRGPF